MTLSNQLTSTPHRETAGSGSYAAFEYQVMFGVELLFEKFNELNDYAVLFEFHDDVVLLTGTSEPKAIEFFQLKHSTTGNWTLAKLSQQKKKKDTNEKGLSIIQKLYQNVLNFKNFTTNAQVVSNAFFSDIGEAQSASMDVIPGEQKEKLLQHLKQVDKDVAADCLGVLGFRRSELDKSSCYELIKGRVHSFLQTHVGGDAFQLQACTDAIVTQCRLRNKKLASDVPADMAQIVAQKGVSRVQISQWLSDIKVSKRAPNWEIIQPHLIASWTFNELNAVRDSYERYKVVALDSSNDAQNSIVRCVRETLVSKNINAPLGAFVDTLIGDDKLQTEAKTYGYQSTQLKAIFLYEIFKSEQTGEIQEVDSKPPEEIQ